MRSIVLAGAIFAAGICCAEGSDQTINVDSAAQSLSPNAKLGAGWNVTFVPPQGWQMADSKELSPNVKSMVVGKGDKEFPPSINLAVEPYKGTQKEYLKIVKRINEAGKREWKDLGIIRTSAGDASLSQVDETGEWGSIRMMHVILVKESIAYILTAAATREEFSRFYKDFFAAMRSLNITKEEKS